MQCYNPRVGFRRLDNTRILYSRQSWSTYILKNPLNPKLPQLKNSIFSKYKNIDLTQPLKLPCGKCEACTLNRAGDTAKRAYDEYRTNQNIGMFITLTYNSENLPKCGHFFESHAVEFMRDLRNKICIEDSCKGDRFDWKKLKMINGCRGYCRKIRSLGVAEYGERTKRPHFHLLVFGYEFPDKKLLRKTDSTHSGHSYDIYETKTLRTLWSYGISEFGSVTEQSCSYVARYLFKKNKKADEGKPCEICKNKKPKKSKIVCRSRRPGLGAEFCDRYFSLSRVNPNAVRNKSDLVPRYYRDRICKSLTQDDCDLLKAKPDYEKNRESERKERLDALKKINQSKFKHLYKNKI